MYHECIETFMARHPKMRIFAAGACEIASNLLKYSSRCQTLQSDPHHARISPTDQSPFINLPFYNSLITRCALTTAVAYQQNLEALADFLLACNSSRVHKR